MTARLAIVAHRERGTLQTVSIETAAELIAAGQHFLVCSEPADLKNTPGPRVRRLFPRNPDDPMDNWFEWWLARQQTPRLPPANKVTFWLYRRIHRRNGTQYWHRTTSTGDRTFTDVDELILAATAYLATAEPNTPARLVYEPHGGKLEGGHCFVMGTEHRVHLMGVPGWMSRAFVERVMGQDQQEQDERQQSEQE